MDAMACPAELKELLRSDERIAMVSEDPVLLRQKHPVEMASTSNQVACLLCAFKTHEEASHVLYKHQREAHRAKYECWSCRRQFHSSVSLRQHSYSTGHIFSWLWSHTAEEKCEWTPSGIGMAAGVDIVQSQREVGVRRPSSEHDENTNNKRRRTT